MTVYLFFDCLTNHSRIFILLVIDLTISMDSSFSLNSGLKIFLASVELWKEFCGRVIALNPGKSLARI